MNIDSSSRSASSTVDDCWNRIGVRGDGSCKQLEQHVHCRNCPVFATAAAQLLNGELPAHYVNEWTDHFARTKPVERHESKSVVIFRLGTEWLALPTPVFKEVAEPRPIHALPHRRDGLVLGVVNVRGELLVCVALERALGLQRTGAQKPERQHRLIHERLLVISKGGNRLVFPADEVHGTHRFSEEQLCEVPASVAKGEVTYSKAILRWEKESVGILDDHLLFYALNRGLS